MKIRIIVLSLLTIAVFIGIFQLLDTKQESAYRQKLYEDRREKNRFFMVSEYSPLVAEQKKSFKGLEYFSPDESWVVSAKWTPATTMDTLLLPTNSGEPDSIIVMGKVEFKIREKTFVLTAYLNPYDSERPLFIPFKDKTSGIESYGGGRYLDANSEKDGVVLLDFNMAYNPFCAYNADYSCFFPPLENVLPVEVTAGEKFVQAQFP